MLRGTQTSLFPNVEPYELANVAVGDRVQLSGEISRVNDRGALISIDGGGTAQAPHSALREQPQPETQENCSLNLTELIRAADALSLDDLHQLQYAIADLVHAKEAEVERLESAASDGDGDARSVPGAGWIEEKKINGCGPYRYLRWRDGKRQRSTYLGKASDTSM